MANILINGDFEADKTGWIYDSTGIGSWDIVSPGNNSPKATRLTINTIGTYTQFFQRDTVLKPNTRYMISFDAYSMNGVDFRVVLSRLTSPYTNYGLNYTPNLDMLWKTFSIEFTTTGFPSQTADTILWFSFNNTGTYFIDNIVLEEVTTVPICPIPSFGYTIAEV
jgi:hypothetical protein